MKKPKLFLLCLTLITILLFTVVPVTLAQGALTYGSAATGSLSATSPLAVYTFSGTTGDNVTIRIIGLTPGFQPSVSLNAPNQQQLATRDYDPYSPGIGDARIDYRLPANGVYVILVGGVDGAGGDYVLTLDGSPAVESAPLTGEAQTAALSPEANRQVFSFAVDPASPLQLTLTTDTAGFNFRAIVRTANGAISALLPGSDLLPATALIPAGDETYEVEVNAVNPGASGAVSLSLSPLTGAAPTAPPAESTEAVDVPEPVATEEVDVPAPAETEEVDTAGQACQVSSPDGNNRNVRGGPGTDYAVVAQLQPGSPLAVIGINGDWYALALPGGGTGWVRNDVVNISGDCGNLPFVDAPAGNNGAAPVQATPTATAPANNAAPPTATYTPSYTPTTEQQQNNQQQATATTAPPTATYTPSYTPTTPPPPPIAPEDARSNSPLNVQLDTTASVTDFVSYPDGDREDRVSYSVRGMNSSVALPGGRARLIIAVSCFGTGTDQITFFTGGQSYSCGQTVVDREVTFDSNTGSVVITAVGGQGTYVQWVLTGTATRIN